MPPKEKVVNPEAKNGHEVKGSQLPKCRGAECSYAELRTLIDDLRTIIMRQDRTIRELSIAATNQYIGTSVLTKVMCELKGIAYDQFQVLCMKEADFIRSISKEADQEEANRRVQEHFGVVGGEKVVIP